MTKEKIMIYTIIIAVMIGATFGWFYHTHKPMSHKKTEVIISSSESEKQEEQIEENQGEFVQLEPFKTARYITVEKVLRTTTEDANGNYETKYDTYLVSDIDLESGMDNTEEFSKALSGSEYNEAKIESVAFSDKTGISYDGLNGLELLEKMLEVEGFDGDLSDTVLDEETQALTQQNIYIVQSKCSALDNLILINQRDSVLDQKVYYQTTKLKDGTVIPDYYVAVVRYMEGDKTVEKSLYLQISINEWEEE